MTEDLESFHARLVAVSEAVGAVSKESRNATQGYNFRGVDQVVNAVHPALNAQGLVLSIRCLRHNLDIFKVGAKQTPMAHAIVEVEFKISRGQNSITSTVPAEAFDSGDKATAKAMSVALRTFLLQAFLLPTDTPDPDLEAGQLATVADDLAAQGFAKRIENSQSKEELHALWLETDSPRLRAKIQARAEALAGGN